MTTAPVLSRAEGPVLSRAEGQGSDASPAAGQREIDVLLTESGGWVIGLDANTVTSVRRIAGGSTDLRQSAAYLLGRALDALEPARQELLITVRGSDGEHPVTIERIIAIESVAATAMAALPLVLRRVGVPSWIVGTTWRGSQLVLLVDLGAAVAFGGVGADGERPDAQVAC